MPVQHFHLTIHMWPDPTETLGQSLICSTLNSESPSFQLNVKFAQFFI